MQFNATQSRHADNYAFSVAPLYNHSLQSLGRQSRPPPRNEATVLRANICIVHLRRTNYTQRQK